MKSVLSGLLTGLLFFVSAGTTTGSQQPASPSPSPQTEGSSPAPPESPSQAASQAPLLAVQPMEPGDIARQIYSSAFRLNDLLSTLNSADWKLDDSARKELNDSLEALRGQLKTLESRRYQFSYQPKNVAAGTELANAIASLAPGLNVIVNDLGKYQGATDAASFKQAEDRLLGFEAPLKQYLASLQPASTQPASGEAASSTVPNAAAPAAAPAPTLEQAQAAPVKPSPAPAPAVPSSPPPAAESNPVSSNPVSPESANPAAPSAATPPPTGAAAPETPAQSQPQTQPSIQAAPQPPAPAQAQIQPQVLSNQIYAAAYRFNDLLNMLNPSNWNMDDASRKSLNDTLASLRSGFKSLEERRYQFSGQLANVAFGKDVASGIEALRPDLDVMVGYVTKYESPSVAEPLKQAEDRLLSLDPQLGQYLTSLESPAKPGAAASVGATAAPGTAPGLNAPIQTEEIAVAAAPPPSTTLLLGGAVTPEQMKDVAHEIYVATYRVKDLLNLVNPADWKTSEALRGSSQTQIEQLRSVLKSLESSRADLSQSTGSLPIIFATYKGMTAVIEGVNKLADALLQYQSGDVATQFRQTTVWLTKSQGTLEGYFEQMLKRQSGSVQNYETDLASCQTTLNYSMYSHSVPAVTMPNIMPVLQGRRVRAKKAALAAGQPAPARHTSGEKAKATPNVGAATTSAEPTKSAGSKNAASSKDSKSGSSGSRRRRHSRHKAKNGQ